MIKLHPFSNGKSYGWGSVHSLLDFFLPYGKRQIRCEATTSAEVKDGVVTIINRNFYTFRAFLSYYWGEVTNIADAKEFWRSRIGVSSFSFNAIGAVAFDAATVNQSGSGVSSLTFSHTATGSNLLVTANVLCSSSGTLTGVTYATTPMIATSQTPQTVTGVGKTHAYRLLSASSGANNMVISASAATNIFANAASYSGVSQFDTDGFTKDEVGTTTFNISLSSVRNNCWHIVCFCTGENPSAGTGTTKRGGDVNGLAIMDSNSAKTPAGSVTLQGTTIGSVNWSGHIMTVTADSPATNQGAVLMASSSL